MTKSNNQYENQFINHSWVSSVPGVGVRWIGTCVTPFLSPGRTSHEHIEKTGNTQGVGLWRMAEAWKQEGIARRPRGDGKKRQEKWCKELNIEGDLWKRPDDTYTLCLLCPVSFFPLSS